MRIIAEPSHAPVSRIERFYNGASRVATTVMRDVWQREVRGMRVADIDLGDRLPTLDAGRVQLRWLTEADVPALYAIFRDDAVTRYYFTHNSKLGFHEK